MKTAASSVREISVPAARLAIAAMLIYHVTLIALIFLRPDLDPSWHTISEWAIGPYGWIMTAAFLISGLTYASLFVAIRSQMRGTLGKIGLVILLICTIGTVGVGIFTTDPMPFGVTALSTTGILHIIFGTTAMTLLPFGALLINLSLALKNEAWASARRALLWTAGVPFLGSASATAYTIIFVVPLGPTAYGPGVHIGWPPRVIFWSYMIWLITLAWQAMKLRRQASCAQPGSATT